MTPKQKRFVEEYLVDLNATQAASRAGYKDGNIGRQLITKNNVAKAIAAGMKACTKRTEITQEWVLETLRENVERAMQHEPVIVNGVKTGEYVYQGAVASRALELIGKHIGMFIERKEIGKPGEFTAFSRDQLDADIRATAAVLGIDVGIGTTNGTGKPRSVH